MHKTTKKMKNAGNNQWISTNIREGETDQNYSSKRETDNQWTSTNKN